MMNIYEDYEYSFDTFCNNFASFATHFDPNLWLTQDTILKPMEPAMTPMAAQVSFGFARLSFE